MSESSRLEAKRLMEVAEDLLGVRDLQASRRFAKRAQEFDPHVEGADQIVAIIDVLLASDKRINRIYVDWYALLQLDRRDVDLDQIKRQYKRLALLLHPDKNKFPLAATAFKLICDASSCLSDPVNRSVYDTQTSRFNNYEPIVLNTQPPPPPPPPRPQPQRTRKPAKAAAVEESQSGVSSFWTVCPYCYYLYEYPRVYEDCCLRCQNCRRGFHGAVVQSPPPPVGDVKDFYYCTWAFFPIRCVVDNDLVKNSSWTPSTSMFSAHSQSGKRKEPSVEDFVDTRGGVETDDNNVLRKQSFEEDGNKFGANVRMPVQDVSGDNHVEHHKTSRPKTTARKTVVSKPIVTKRTASKSTTPILPNKKKFEVHTKVIEENIIPEWVGMDLNLEIAETEEPIKAEPVRVGIQGIDLEATEGIEFFESMDKEATEGIEFFEGLDSLLGNIGPTDPAG